MFASTAYLLHRKMKKSTIYRKQKTTIVHNVVMLHASPGSVILLVCQSKAIQIAIKILLLYWCEFTQCSRSIHCCILHRWQIKKTNQYKKINNPSNTNLHLPLVGRKSDSTKSGGIQGLSVQMLLQMFWHQPE